MRSARRLWFARPGALEAAIAEQTRAGIDALNRGDPQAAQQAFETVLHWDPTNGTARLRLVEACEAQSNLAGAIAHLQRFLEREPNQASQQVRLGELYRQAGQLTAAERQARLAIQIDQRCSAGWVLQGDVSCARGEWSRALDAYQRATSVVGNQPDLQFKIGGVYERLGQPLRALSAYERVLEQFAPDSTPHPALLKHGLLLTELRQYRRAIEQLSQATRQPDASLESLIGLSHAQLLAGRMSESRQTLVRARELYPDSPLLQELQARLTPDTEPPLVHAAAKF